MKLGKPAFLLATMCTPAPVAAAEPALPTVCDANPVRRQIEQALFGDPEFHQYVCGDSEPCSEKAFAEQIVLRQALLRGQPATWGCFAQPKRQATTGLFVLFLVQDAALRWEMTFSGLSLDPKFGHQTNGYVDLQASERLYPATWLTHHFVWNGKGYVLEHTDAVTVD